MVNTREQSGSLVTAGQEPRSGSFFSKMTSAALRDWAAIEVTQLHQPNVVLFSEKEASRGIFVVLSGEVRLSINSSEGKRLSLRIARRGDVLGLSSALSGAGSDMTAETLYPAKIAFIDRGAFNAFLARHPEMYPIVTEELGRQMAMTCEQLRTVGLSATAPERLARLLLEWSEADQVDGCGRLRFSLTHEEIGEFIGASRETVTRTLSHFKTRRLVSFRGSMMEIPNRSALAHFANA